MEFGYGNHDIVTLGKQITSNPSSSILEVPQYTQSIKLRQYLLRHTWNVLLHHTWNLLHDTMSHATHSVPVALPSEAYCTTPDLKLAASHLEPAASHIEPYATHAVGIPSASHPELAVTHLKPNT